MVLVIIIKIITIVICVMSITITITITTIAIDIWIYIDNDLGHPNLPINHGAKSGLLISTEGFNCKKYPPP